MDKKLYVKTMWKNNKRTYFFKSEARAKSFLRIFKIRGKKVSNTAGKTYTKPYGWAFEEKR